MSVYNRPPPHPGANMPRGMPSIRGHRKASQSHAPQQQQQKHVPAQVGQHQAQAQHAAAQVQLEKRYLRRPVERSIPAKIETLVPNATLYRELRELEQNLDSTITRKRLDVEDALTRKSKERRKFQIFVSNTAIDQPWQTVDRLDENAFDFDMGTIPSWALRIEGRLVDDNDNEHSNDDNFPQQSSNERKKFTEFFQSIAIELDRPKELYPEGNIIIWNQQPKNAQAPPQIMLDSIDIKRKGDTDVNAKISFYLSSSPERYKLSPPLSNVLGGLKEDTKHGIVRGLWEYVKYYNLQEGDERRFIRIDGALAALFPGQERITFPLIIEQVNAHLLPLDPIVINYTIKVNTELTQLEQPLEIEVDVESPQRKNLEQLLINYNNQDEILALDDQIGITIQELANSKLRRDFFAQMAHDPAGFVDRWVGSQARDLEIVLGDRELQSEDVRRSNFYTNDVLEESVFLLVNKK
ncbi:hypothetical protein V1514DRAFT_332471 [Lipomyces japonicus]|uniref:uncharacterized protein n=1 Tax=Lipomyces japonicus TaxID=56871 RepID=UPI0034CD1DCD